MKKLILALIALLIIAIAAIYVLIPEKVVVNRIVYTNIKPGNIIRCLHDDLKWLEWFPGKKNGNNSFLYKGKQYSIKNKDYNSTIVAIEFKNKNYISQLSVINLSADSSAIQWQVNFENSNNPLTRFTNYEEAKALKTDIDNSLNSFAKFVQNIKNIYGFDINYTTLTDTALVSITRITKQYPDTRTIYQIIDTLKSYIISQRASIHNYPMLNITTLKDSSYKLMVGLPTNIPLKGNYEIFPKRMVMIKNKTLVTDVKGDANEIKKAFTAIKYFMQDNHYQSPVIPFQQLILNRNEQPDSTKWITKIFAPYN